jgi:hypothetical protein
LTRTSHYRFWSISAEAAAVRLVASEKVAVMNMKASVISAALMSIIAAGAASADVLTVGGGWDRFGFGDIGSSFPVDAAHDFSFTLTSAAVFNITDAFTDGDQFDITINGVDKGLTSTPTNDGTYVGTDFDAAFASPLFSHASYNLGPGSYTVTGVVALAPFTGGSGGAELVAGVVPEPATWSLMLVGFVGMGAVVRRRQRRATAY